MHYLIDISIFLNLCLKIVIFYDKLPLYTQSQGSEIFYLCYYNLTNKNFRARFSQVK